MIFNFKTWLEITKAILIRYATKNREEARILVISSSLACNSINNSMAVSLRSYETEYHWAMLIAYGERYWENGIHSDGPEGYLEWDKEYRESHCLAEESFEFKD